MDNTFNIGSDQYPKTIASPGYVFTQNCSKDDSANHDKTPDKTPDKVKIYEQPRRLSSSRDMNVSIRLSAEEFERLRLRALMLRTDCSKLIRSRLDDIISSEHICEVCQKHMASEDVQPETEGGLFGTL